MKSFKLLLIALAGATVLVLNACSESDDNSPPATNQDDGNSASTSELIPSTFSVPLFPNSIVSTDIDYIHSDDPDNYDGFTYKGREVKEIPGSETDLLNLAFVFEMSFTDGSVVEAWCHSSFGDENKAAEYVEKLGVRYGKLPVVHRRNINHVVINTGDKTAFAELSGHFFVLFSDNMDVRISNNDLEETIFHEAVHASIQDDFQMSESWRRASNADRSHITRHAEREIEDMAETAIFAYTLENNPERLPDNVKQFLIDHIPNKIAFFDQFYK